MEINSYTVSILSAAIGAAVAIVTNFWRTTYTIKAQDFSKRIEEISSAINKLEVLACEYWFEREKNKTSAAPYILGTQAKISLTLDYLNSQYNRFDQTIVSIPLTEFFKACSGDDFESPEATSEPQRIRRILITGETLKIELMKIRNTLY